MPYLVESVFIPAGPDFSEKSVKEKENSQMKTYAIQPFSTSAKLKHSIISTN